MTAPKSELVRLRYILCPQLSEFVEIARVENLTSAARSLGVQQPTLSRSLARLQRQLGVPLFVRQGRSIRLTKQGRSLLACGERTLATLEAGIMELIADDDPVIGLVRFNFLRSFRARAVPDILKGFRRDHPGVRFSLGQGSTDSIVAAITEDRVDIGIVAPPSVDHRVTSVQLWSEPMELVVPSSHRLADATEVDLTDVADDEFIVLQQGYGTRTLADLLCTRAGFSPRVAFETEDVTLARGLVEAGFGVALLPPIEEETHKGVVALRLVDPKASRKVSLTWTSERPLGEAVVTFRNFVIQLFSGASDPNT